MKIKLGFEEDELPSRYTKYAEVEEKYKDVPIISFPFSIEDVPAGTKYFCITLIDHDAIPVCGFSWIHWSVANIPVEQTSIPENYSQDGNYPKVQGINSFASLIANEDDLKIIYRYAGPTPPDRDHKYKLTIFAITEMLELKEGFYLNEMFEKMETVMIEKSSINVIGKV